MDRILRHEAHELWAKAARVAAVLIVALSVAGLAACGGDDESSAGETTSTAGKTLEGTTLTVLLFTDIFEEQFRKAWLDPFTAETGAKFVVDAPTDYAKLKTQVEAKNVTYDVANADPYEVDPNCGKLWEHIEGVDLSDVLSQFKPTSDCGVPDYIFAYHISNSKKVFPNGGPRNCVDFFDTKKYPGKRGLWSYFFNGAIECAAIAAGAEPDSVYPLDLGAAYAKLEEIKDDVVIYDSPAEAGDLMQNDDVASILLSNRATAQIIDEGADWEPSFDWSIRAVGYFSIPKGAPNKKASEQFLNYILDRDVSRRLSNEIAYGSVTGGPLGPDLPAFYKPFDPVEGKLADNATDIDWNWWIDNFKEITDRWNKYTTS